MISVDARGLSCPHPVILTKRVMDGGEKDITTIVDNTTALENITRLAASQGYTVEVENQESEYHVHMTRTGQRQQKTEDDRDIAILIKSNLFGDGDKELGQVLMKSFLYALVESEDRITHLIFMNSGVFLTTEGSPVLDHLKAISEKGTEILSCGTCLDFYNLKDSLKVGKVTNMYTAIETLTQATKTLIF